jgi:hypothetical protein
MSQLEMSWNHNFECTLQFATVNSNVLTSRYKALHLQNFATFFWKVATHFVNPKHDHWQEVAV